MFATVCTYRITGTWFGPLALGGIATVFQCQGSGLRGIAASPKVHHGIAAPFETPTTVIHITGTLGGI